MGRFVVPRDARCAALSYDGRETADRLRSLTTLPDSRRIASIAHFTPPGVARARYYVEMVQPNDAARQIRMEPSYPESSLLESDDPTVRTFRARLRERSCLSCADARCWVTTEKYAPDVRSRSTRISLTSPLRWDRNATSRPERG